MAAGGAVHCPEAETLTGDKCLFVLGAEDAGQLSTLPRLVV